MPAFEIPPEPTPEQMHEATDDLVFDIIDKADDLLDRGLKGQEERDTVLDKLDIAAAMTTDAHTLAVIRSIRANIREHYSDDE